LWVVYPIVIDSFDSCGICFPFTLIDALIVRFGGLDFPKTIKNNGQIFGFWHNFFVQSLINNGL